MKINMITMEVISKAAAQFGVAESVAVRIICARAEVEGVEISPEVSAILVTEEVADNLATKALRLKWAGREAVRNELSPKTYETTWDEESRRLNNFIEATSHGPIDAKAWGESALEEEGKEARVRLDNDTMNGLRIHYESIASNIETELAIQDVRRQRAIKLAAALGRAKAHELAKSVNPDTERLLNGMNAITAAERILHSADVRKSISHDLFVAHKNETPISF